MPLLVTVTPQSFDSVCDTLDKNGFAYTLARSGAGAWRFDVEGILCGHVHFSDNTFLLDCAALAGVLIYPDLIRAL